jgi:two-component system LytT family response regulator
MPYRFLIVDDEQLSRQFVRKLINEFVPDAEILEAKSSEFAKAFLREGNIDFLFLDIQMPHISGLELLDDFNMPDFEIIFITAYSQYAIDAIKKGASDYLLKPVNKKEFKNTLDKVINNRERKRGLITDDDLSHSAVQHYRSGKIMVSYMGGIKFIPLSEIIYLRAKNSYTEIYQISNTKTIVSRPISSFNQVLHEHWFFRIHKSYIVNVNFVSEYLYAEACIILQPNSIKLPLSRHRQKEFIEKMNQHKNFPKP